MKKLKKYTLFIIMLTFIFIVNVNAKVITKNVKGTYYYDEAFKQLELMNKERAKVGASALKMDKELFEAAQVRAAEITQVFSHTRPTGKAWSSISTKAYGENILYDSHFGAKQATTGWMGSKGHRENMLYKSYKSVGISCIKYGHVYFWVQVFGYDEADVLATPPKNATKTVSVILSETPDKVSFENEVYYIDKIGDSIIIKYNVEPNDIDANYNLYTRSDLLDIKLVSEGLKVTAKKEGLEQIKISFGGSVEDITNIIIGKNQESISLDKEEYEVEVGKYLELKPTILPSDVFKNYSIKIDTPEYFENVQTNGEAIRVLPKKTGTAKITFYTVDKMHSFTTTIKIVPSTTIYSISIDKTNLKMARGQMVALKATINPEETILDKTITWTSSDENIAKVDSNGVVTAINTGKAIITAKTVNDKTATVEIIVDKVNIKNLKIDNIVNKTYTGKSITQDVKIVDNDKVLVLNKDYKLSYKNNKNIGTATITITGIGNYTGSINKSFKIVVGTPKSLSLSKQTNTTISIKWQKTGSISGYEVYYSTSKDKNYKKVSTTTKTSDTKTKLSSGKTYYFKVRAYKTINGKKKYSSYSNVLKSTTTTKAPSIKLSSNTSSVLVKWGKVSGASSYEIYRSTDNKKYTKIGETKSTSYKVNNLDSSKKYYYKVRGYKLLDNNKINGSYSKVVSIVTKPLVPEVEVESSKNSIKLSWHKVPRVSGYEIYYKDSSKGKYKKISTTTKDSYTKTKLKSNKTYYFKIRSYKTISGKKTYSSYVNITIKTL